MAALLFLLSVLLASIYPLCRSTLSDGMDLAVPPLLLISSSYSVIFWMLMFLFAEFDFSVFQFFFISYEKKSSTTSVLFFAGDSLLAAKKAWELDYSSWQENTDPCNGWMGIKCDADNRVTYLYSLSLFVS